MNCISIARVGHDKTVCYAAEELKKYLNLMDPDAMVDMLSYETYAPDSRDGLLWVGRDASLDKQMPAVKNAELDDAVLIDVTDFAGVISGINERSVLLAVYRFLRELGAKFLRPNPYGEIIPHRVLDKCCVSVCEAASYRYRNVCIEGATGAQHAISMIEWLPKVGLNSYYIQFFNSHLFYKRWYEHDRNPAGERTTFTLEQATHVEDMLCEEIAKRSLIHMAVGHGWTCIPFGVSDTARGLKDSDLDPKYLSYIAMKDGKRGLPKNGAPAAIQLCYSNPAVRHKMVDAVVDYCEKHPNVHLVELSYADGENNHCECDSCRQKTPSDWLVDILNELDEKLTAKGIKTIIIFEAYVDTLWAPTQGKINNPDRFLMMFAPISRNFFTTIDHLDMDAVKSIKPFALNHNSYPGDMAGNVKMLQEWKKCYNGDFIDYDYHLWSGCVRDLGYAGIGHSMFFDCENLDKIECNGYISCQPMRFGLPTNLPMNLMAVALWDKTADYKTAVDDYYRASFGEGWKQAKAYLEKLTAYSAPRYGGGKDNGPKLTDKKMASLARKAYELADSALPMIEENMNRQTHITCKKSWEYLLYHREIAKRYALVFEADHNGSGNEKVRELYKQLIDYAFSIEPAVHHVFDAWRLAGGLREWYW